MAMSYIKHKHLQEFKLKEVIMAAKKQTTPGVNILWILVIAISIYLIIFGVLSSGSDTQRSVVLALGLAGIVTATIGYKK
jgi:hypothetical protein